MSFEYRPLRAPAHMIRLLDVQPQIQNVPLSCRIRHALLNQVPSLQYETISYVWGNPCPISTILVNGLSLRVPANTEKVLRRVAFANRPRCLWIDAVCINQNDKAERGQQVVLMGEIYSRAKQTLVYLGDGSPEMCNRMNQTFIDILEEILITERSQTFASIVMDDEDKWIRASSGMAIDIDEEALLAFFGCVWFTRLWVVQEVVLASATKFYWGALENDLDSILNVAAWLREHHLRTTPMSLMRCDGLYNAVSIWNFRRQYAHSTTGLDIASALDVSRDLDATDMRDRVFGVLGMCDQHPGKLVHAHLLTPDYDKHVSEVLRDAVRYCITTSPDPFYVLRNISHRCEGDLKTGIWPSWVPRFDRKLDGDHDPEVLVEHLLSAQPEHMDWALVDDASVSGILQMPGVMIDQIEIVSPIFNADTSGDLVKSEQYLRYIIALSSRLAIQQTQVSRTLIADTNHIKMKSSEQDLLGLVSTLEHLQARRRIAPPGELGEDSEEAAVSAAEYWQATLDSAKNRRVVVTKGKRLALAPQVSRPNDILVLFDGSLSPFLLRREAERQFLLGECYLDGLMPWQEHSENVVRGKEEVFHLS